MMFQDAAASSTPVGHDRVRLGQSGRTYSVKVSISEKVFNIFTTRGILVDCACAVL